MAGFAGTTAQRPHTMRASHISTRAAPSATENPPKPLLFSVSLLVGCVTMARCDHGAESAINTGTP